MQTSGVTLEGAGRERTIIASNSAYSSSNRGISIRPGVGNLVIRDLTVDGGPAATFHDGIWWEGGGDHTVIERVAVRNVDRRGISVFPQTLTNTTLRDVVVDNVTGTNSGTSAGGLAIVFNSAGTIENAQITRAKTGITGTVDGGPTSPLRVSGVHVSEFTGIDTTFFNLGMSFNTFPNRAPVMTITNNTVIANVERNSGLYLVAPGPGSVVADNFFLLQGDLGYGIETGWSPSGDVTIERNVIISGRSALGILVTGAGNTSAPVVVRDNMLRNLSQNGTQDIDFRNWGILDGREVGLLVSADPHTSRTGDANYNTHVEVRGNSIIGFTTSLGFLADDSVTPKELSATVIGNRILATGTAAVHIKQLGSTRTPKTQVEVITDIGASPIDISGNFWGGNGTTFGSVEREFDATVIDLLAGNSTTFAPARSTSQLEQLLQVTGFDSAESASRFRGPDLSSLELGSRLSGAAEWDNPVDDSIEIWGYSTPTLLAASVPVVDGQAVFQNLDLSALSAGEHYLVLVGQQSGELLVLPLTLIVPSVPPVYLGPVVSAVTPAGPGQIATVSGRNLSSVSHVEIDGELITVTEAYESQFVFRVPNFLSPGMKDIKIFSLFGRLTVQSAFELLPVSTQQPGRLLGQISVWTVRMRDSSGNLTNEAKMYAKNPIGEGKVQFYLNGREIAWIRAVDESDPKLRLVTEGPMAGIGYLVRTVTLMPGKNALEIYVEGERLRRTAYSFIG